MKKISTLLLVCLSAFVSLTSCSTDDSKQTAPLLTFIKDGVVHVNRLNINASYFNTQESMGISCSTDDYGFAITFPYYEQPGTITNIYVSYVDENTYVFNEAYDSEVKITEVDLLNKTITGTFRLKSYYDSPVPLKISGQFIKVPYNFYEE